MKTKDVVIGSKYAVKVSGREVAVKVIGEAGVATASGRPKFLCVNLRTGRKLKATAGRFSPLPEGAEQPVDLVAAAETPLEIVAAARPMLPALRERYPAPAVLVFKGVSHYVGFNGGDEDWSAFALGSFDDYMRNTIDAGCRVILVERVDTKHPARPVEVVAW
jgi:hypothetical protein